jgi:hypothetical protein
MIKEQLRWKMLAGIITETQYKEKIEEIDSMGRVGKSTPAPGYENEKKSWKKSQRKKLEKRNWDEKFKKILSDLYQDASKGLIYTSPSPNPNDGMTVYVDENGKYKYLLTGEKNIGLGEVPYYNKTVQPSSKSTSSPYKLDIPNFNAIIHAVLNSGVQGPFPLPPNGRYHIKPKLPNFQFGGKGGTIIQIGWVGYVVDLSKFTTEGNPEFGTPHKLGNNLAFIPYHFTD